MTVDAPAITSAEFVHDLLRKAADVHPERNSVRDRDGVWSYAELDRNARRAARWLDDLGARPGMRLLCVLPGSRDFAALLFGALSRGVIVVPVAEDASDYQLRHLLADATPAAVVTTADRVPAIAALTSVPVVAPRYADASVAPAGTGPAVSPDDPALLIYTSGTTARPKGIVCPHRAVVWAAQAIAERVGYRPTDIVYNRVPVSFDYGLYQLFLAAIAGAEVVYPHGPASRRELIEIRARGVTVLPVVPTLALLLAQLRERDPRPTSVRLLTNTGAALVGRDVDRVRAAFPEAALICMYGMSECKRITITEPDEDLTYPGTVGWPLRGTRLFVLGPNGEPLPRGGTGEIVVAGPHVMDGYWGAAAAVQQRERFVAAPDGVGRALRTGDFGYLDSDGRLYFEGRRDDLFKRRGWRVSCQEVECAALDVAGVEQAACLPPGPDGTLTIWTTGTASPLEVKRGIEARLGAAKTPDRFVPVQRMPLTPNGKIDKAALADCGPGRFPQPPPAGRGRARQRHGEVGPTPRAPGDSPMTPQAADAAPTSVDVEEVTAVLRAHAADVDQQSRFPVESFAMLRRHGYLGLLVPTEYGGMGAGLDELVQLAQKFAGGCLSTAMIWAMHCQQTDLVVRHATPELRARLLPRIAAGEVYLASVTTEAGKGGQLLSANDSLVTAADGISIDRRAPVVTGAMHANGFLITMRDHPDAGEHEVTLIYADRDNVTIEPTGEWRMMGMRGTHSVGVRITGQVPTDCVVGRRGKFREAAADSMVPVGHLAWSACWLGAARTAFVQLIRRIVVNSGKPGGTDVASPLVQERVARIRLDLELVSAYLSKVSAEVSEIRAGDGRLDVPAVQIHLNSLKLAASELTFRAVDRMVQLAGLATGYGTASSIPLERTFRDLRSAALNYSNDRLWTTNGALSWVDRTVTLL